MTNRLMFNFHNEIQTWQQTGSVLAHFNSKQIIKFYQQYGQRINTLSVRITELTKEYFVTEPDGKIYKISRDEKGAEILLPGMDGNNYRKELDDLLDKEIIIHNPFLVRN